MRSTATRLFLRFGSRVKRGLSRHLWKLVLPFARPLARLYRMGPLRRVAFIGVTGSAGKTTTKELIHAILSTRLRGEKNIGNVNVTIMKTLVRVRPWHKYCVQEIAAARGGERVPLERPLALIRPRIGVVTNIGTDHLSAFGSKEAIAAEKSKLVAAVPQMGAAVLNADDPHVIAMRSKCRGRVITYGLSPDAMIRAENISCIWPERLSFDLLHDGQRHHVRTQLCGLHWTTCVLAAIGASLQMGVPVADSVRAVAAFAPPPRRMEPIVRADGIVFIRDDMKAPAYAIGPTLDFMKTAKARRKIAVIGTISDYAGASDTMYRNVARAALDAVDLVIFVGPKSSKCAKAKKHPRGEALQMFFSVAQASEYLADVLRPGDLVLLKGSQHSDDLGRLCTIETRGQHAGQAGDALNFVQKEPAASNAPTPKQGRPVKSIVGFGNAGEEYRDTPHNVGQRALDHVARSLGAEWRQVPDALVATADYNGVAFHLIKPMTGVNNSGAILLRLSREIGFGPEECLMLQDDMDLPLGTLRVRAKGSDGGHRGVRSVLQAFGTAEIARVKIGVGRPAQQTAARDHVLRPFSPSELAVVEAACANAADKVMELSYPSKLAG
jgi:aminoacyl-tRNA hydrolase